MRLNGSALTSYSTSYTILGWLGELEDIVDMILA